MIQIKYYIYVDGDEVQWAPSFDTEDEAYEWAMHDAHEWDSPPDILPKYFIDGEEVME
jgi:hypothetical protein